MLASFLPDASCECLSFESAGNRIQVTDLRTITQFGGQLAVDARGGVWFWGEMGNNPYQSIPPVRLLSVPNATLMGLEPGTNTEEQLSILLEQEGTVYRVTLSVPSDGSPSPSATKPEPVLEKVKKVSVTGGLAAALLEDESLYVWGRMDGFASPQPVRLAIQGVTDFTLGRTYLLALTAKKQVYAWGRADYGQTGQKSDTLTKKPVQLGLKKAEELRIMGNCCYGRNEKGQWYGWGGNTAYVKGDMVYGTLGVNSQADYVTKPSLVKDEVVLAALAQPLKETPAQADALPTWGYSLSGLEYQIAPEGMLCVRGYDQFLSFPTFGKDDFIPEYMPTGLNLFTGVYEPQPAQESKGGLFRLIEAGILEVSVSAIGINSAVLIIRNLENEPITASITPALALHPQDDSIQRLRITENREVALDAYEELRLTVKTVCADYYRDIPVKGSVMTLGYNGTYAMMFAEGIKQGYGYPVLQAAIWLVDDHSSYDITTRLSTVGGFMNIIFDSDYEDALHLAADLGVARALDLEER